MQLFLRPNAITIRISSLVLLLMTMFVNLHAYAEKEPETGEEFLRIFQSGTQLEQQKAAAALQWAGISSPQLFDVIESLAIKTLPFSAKKANTNYESYLVKALAYSGDEKYRPILQKIVKYAPHKKVKKHAAAALKILASYRTLNPIIAPRSWPEYTHPTLNQRLLNMLNSENTVLMRLAAKRIHFSLNYEPELLAALKSIIEKNYKEKLDRDRVDAVAWVCQALAGTRDPAYRRTIVVVAQAAKEYRLRKYARKYARHYLKYYG